jgi:hypothetical protein
MEVPLLFRQKGCCYSACYYIYMYWSGLVCLSQLVLVLCDLLSYLAPI